MRPIRHDSYVAGIDDEARAELVRNVLQDRRARLVSWREEAMGGGALADVAGSLPSEVVHGRHGWLLSDPEQFGSVLHDSLLVHAMLEQERRGRSLVPDEDTTLAKVIPHERRRRARTPETPRGPRGTRAPRPGGDAS